MIHTSFSFVFFGTPQLSADILEHLKQHNMVPSLIVTNPDRPRGRKMALTPPPVKVWAEANDIPLLQPENPRDPDFLGQLSKVNAQLFVVVAYGSILSKELLSIPRKGSLNIHYSLLPRLRGASPIESAILQDVRDTGVSILLLDEEMDHGPIVAERQLACTDWPVKASVLRDACNKLGAELLTETIPLWVDGKIEAKVQDHSKATYTKKFTKADGELDLSADPYKNFLKICAFESSIGTYFYYTEATRNAANTEQTRKTRVIIKSAEYKDGKLVITSVVPAGKKEMSYEEFLRGIR